MIMNARLLFKMLKKCAVIAFLLAAGCASPGFKHVQRVSPVVAPVFPPQEVMQAGDYIEFLKENQAVIKDCQDEVQCAMALFNLGFIYAYPKSPYYDQRIGQHYFDELVKKYPESPWAFEARVWSEIVRKGNGSEADRQRLRGEVRSQKTAIKELQKQIEQSKEELQKQIDQSKEVDMEIDRREKELQKQIERSRQIDLEMDRKERELLQ
jgi:hypothetical protein